jgi:hypothetical protein
VALEVISDLRSERHRDWVSSTVIGALGVELDQGVWVLRLYAVDPAGVRIVLMRSGGAAFELRIAKPGRDRRRVLGRALWGAVSAWRR